MSARIAVVTGASSGIGASIAVRLAAEGWEPLLVARRKDKLEETAARVKAAGGKAHLLVQDVTAPDAADTVLAHALKLGTPEVLVNNAGFGLYGFFAGHDRAVLQRMIDTNIRALTEFTAAFLPGMIEREKGWVLQVASTAAFQAMPYNAAYAASKAFVLLLGEGIATELRDRKGVSCTTLCPGPTDSEFFTRGHYHDGGLLPVPKAIFMANEKVANIAVRAMLKRRAVIIAGIHNKAGAVAAQMVPRAAIAGMLGAVMRPRKG